jgi:dTDP-4-dehydrorhamnose 3,5-epimerase
MLFTELDLPGAFFVAPERQVDARGHFARTFCPDEFATQRRTVSFMQL